MSIFINEQRFIFVLFVFQLLNHSDEQPSQLGGRHSTFTGGGGHGPCAAPLITALAPPIMGNGRPTNIKTKNSSLINHLFRTREQVSFGSSDALLDQFLLLLLTQVRVEQRLVLNYYQLSQGISVARLRRLARRTHWGTRTMYTRFPSSACTSASAPSVLQRRIIW